MLGAFYACSEIILGIVRRSGSADQCRDRHSLRILWLVICVSIAGSIIAANSFRFASFRSREIFIAGLILFAAGIVIRWYSIIHLGRFFTVDVSIAAGHRIIDTGPYRYVRHPSYSASLLSFLGFGISMNNWVALLVVFVPVTIAFLYRIHVEETMLSEALGVDYVEYKKHTKRLVPGIY